jgi:hypothetical protein
MMIPNRVSGQSKIQRAMENIVTIYVKVFHHGDRINNPIPERKKVSDARNHSNPTNCIPFLLKRILPERSVVLYGISLRAAIRQGTMTPGRCAIPCTKRRIVRMSCIGMCSFNKRHYSSKVLECIQ